MLYGSQPISQKLMIHLLLDLPFGCSNNIIVILLLIIIIIIIIIIDCFQLRQYEPKETSWVKI